MARWPGLFALGLAVLAQVPNAEADQPPCNPGPILSEATPLMNQAPALLGTGEAALRGTPVPVPAAQLSGTLSALGKMIMDDRALAASLSAKMAALDACHFNAGPYARLAQLASDLGRQQSALQDLYGRVKAGGSGGGGVPACNPPAAQVFAEAGPLGAQIPAMLAAGGQQLSGMQAAAANPAAANGIRDNLGRLMTERKNILQAVKAKLAALDACHVQGQGNYPQLANGAAGLQAQLSALEQLLARVNARGH